MFPFLLGVEPSCLPVKLDHQIEETVREHVCQKDRWEYKDTEAKANKGLKEVMVHKDCVEHSECVVADEPQHYICGSFDQRRLVMIDFCALI